MPQIVASVSGLMSVSSSNTTNHLKYSLMSDGRLSSVSDIEVFRVDYTAGEKVRHEVHVQRRNIL